MPETRLKMACEHVPHARAQGAHVYKCTSCDQHFCGGCCHIDGENVRCLNCGGSLADA